ncbi:MAG: hypothetical protein JWN39_2611, partial [Ilumatobacteraceae bacterium]|nr:hypothetical protein [Ilumatobacteraceae bacterium]
GDTDCADAPTTTSSPVAAVTTAPIETSTSIAAAPADVTTVVPAVPVATG